MRTLIVSCLQSDGFQVASVSTGVELCQRLELSEEPVPDIVISDIRMPGLSGLEALAKLRSAGCELPVILMTAFGDEVVLNEASQRGATLVLCKPFDLYQLRFAVASLCNHNGFGGLHRPHLPK